MGKTLFLAPRMMRWEGLETDQGAKVASVDRDLGCGYMSVFESMEELLEAFPEVDPQTVPVIHAEEVADGD